MRTIGESPIEVYCPEKEKYIARNCKDIRKGPALEVSDFLELSRKVAELQYLNPGHVLLLRGQSDDFLNSQRNSTLKPSIFRKTNGNSNPEELQERFELLHRAEVALAEVYTRLRLPRANQVQRRRIVRWTILQHYEICLTPLLDVTSSLRIACSFASDHSQDFGYLMIIGVPNISGGITTSIDAELQVVRLASVTPPSALRPHIQEGFLVGEYPEIDGYEQKRLYQPFEIDFGKRLIAKFKFNKQKLWGRPEFPPVSREALYPDESDKFIRVADEVKASIY